MHTNMDSFNSHPSWLNDRNAEPFVPKPKPRKRFTTTMANSPPIRKKENDIDEIGKVEEDNDDDAKVQGKEKEDSSADSLSESESQSEGEKKIKKKSKKNPKASESKSRKKKKKKPVETIQLTDSESGKELVFAVIIHQSDLLPLDPIVIHPVVKVTAMFQNGKYIRRTDADSAKAKRSKHKKKRSKRSKSESDSTDNVAESVLPIMTQPYQPRYSLPSFVPTWNELLVFEEPFKKFAVANEDNDQEKEPILFFEVMDFLPMNTNGNSVSITGFHGSDTGWYKVAWAFLKPIGANGIINLNKKLRLQLYKPVKLRSKDKNPGPEVFSWWKSGKREKIQSTLYVTPKGIVPPETGWATLRQLLSMRKEQLTHAILDSQLPGPVRMKYPIAMLKKSSMAFKNQREKVDNTANNGDAQRPGRGPSGAFPPKRGDSAEKFISIIHKLDTALYFAQQRNKKRNDETKSPTCGVSVTSATIIGRKSSLQGMDKTLNEEDRDQDGKENSNSEVAAPKTERKLESSSMHTQRSSEKKIVAPDRPKSASSIIREKRERLRKSRDWEEDRNISSDREVYNLKQAGESIPVEQAASFPEALRVSSSVDENGEYCYRPKPLKRRTKIQMLVSSAGSDEMQSLNVVE